MTTENQEIDLMKLTSNLFNNIGVGIKKIIIYSFFTIIRYKYIYISIFILITTFTSYSLYNRNSISIRAYFDSPSKEIIESLVKTLNFNFENGNYNYIASTFNIPLTEAKKISKIEIKKEFYEKAPKRQIDGGKLIEIPQPPLELSYFNVSLNNTNMNYSLIQLGLSNYFKNNSYLSKEIQLNSERLTKIKEALTSQLTQILEYQTRILTNPNIKTIQIGENSKIELVNKETLEDKILGLNNSIFDNDKDIEKNKYSIRFINNFTENTKTSNLISIIKFLALFIGLSFVISVFIDFVKWLNKETKKI